MNLTPNLNNLIKACQILQYPTKSYQILQNPSNLTKSSQILAILPSITKYYQSYIESYQYDVDSDESSNLTPNLINLTKACQVLSSPSKSFHPYKILSNLSHLTQYYQVLPILHRILPILHRI